MTTAETLSKASQEMAKAYVQLKEQLTMPCPQCQGCGWVPLQLEKDSSLDV